LRTRIAIITALVFGTLGGIVIGVAIPKAQAAVEHSSSISVYDAATKTRRVITDPVLLRVCDNCVAAGFREGYQMGFLDGGEHIAGKTKKPKWLTYKGPVPDSYEAVMKLRREVR